MAQQVGEVYVSLGVDTKALEKGFTAAQQWGENAAGTIGSVWEKKAAESLKTFTKVLDTATTSIQKYASLVPVIAEADLALDDSVKNFAGSAEGAAESTTSWTGAVSGLGKMFTGVSKGIGTITEVTGAAGSAAVGAASGFTGFLSVLGGAVGIVGSIFGGVVALAAALEQAMNASSDVQALIDYSDNTINAMHNLGAQIGITTQLIGVQSDYTDQLTARIIELGNNTDRTGEQDKELYAKMALLNAMYPEINIAIDEQTGLLNQSVDAINSSVKAMEKRAKTRAVEELMVEEFKKMLTLEAEGIEISQKLKIAGDEQGEMFANCTNNLIGYNKANEDFQLGMQGNNRYMEKYGYIWDQYTGEVVQNTIDVNELTSAEFENIEAKAESGAMLSTLMGMYGEAAVEEEKYTQSLNDNSAAVSGNTIIQNEHVAAFKNGLGEELGLMWEKLKMGEELTAAESLQLEKMQERVLEGGKLTEQEQIIYENGKNLLLEIEQQKLEGYARIKDEMVAAATNSSQKIKLADQLSFKAAKENQKSNLEVMRQFNDDFDYLKSVLPETSKKYLSQMGVDDARMLNEMATLWKDGSQDQVMEYFNGIEEGMMIGSEPVEAAAQERAEGVVEAAGSEMTYEAGNAATEEMTEGEVAGIQEGGEQTKKAVEGQVKDTYSALHTQITNSRFQTEGMRIGKNLADGITAASGMVTSAAQRVADKIRSTFTFSVGVHQTESGAKIQGYDVGGYFTSPQVIEIAEKRPEFVGAAEDLETFIDRAIKDSIVKVNPAINYVIPDRAFPAAGGDSYYDNRVYLDVRPQQMTKEQTDYMINKVNRELGKKLK